MTLTNFETLSIKIEDIIRQYDLVHKDKQRIEAQMLKREKESLELKKMLQVALEERELIKRRLDGLIAKIDLLDSV